MAPKCTFELLSGVPKHKAMMSLLEEIILDKLHSGVSYRAVGCELSADQSILNTVSLNIKQDYVSIGENVTGSQVPNPVLGLGMAILIFASLVLVTNLTS